ncbi:MAG: D-ornithine 4,5-aminomutase subunit OraE [Erysipelotrichaceae bacterium]|nr:D-ornithine 4,5-aminomutase subunit OraE [Erysipelotrichaceae bacterium]
MNRNDHKLDVEKILENLEDYVPRRRGWIWRKPIDHQKIGKFEYFDTSENLKKSVGLPASHAFDSIDPQPKAIITTEIASGRFEDDIRRMRMAAIHGADHMMVIRTAGQSHFDGLIEGTPQGVGGIPITRKQVRAQRKALDIIEDEVGRPINYHSYISGVAGPEIATMFVEEGVNGAHQDPQYNILYRNINMIRSFVDAAESKTIMAYGNLAQIDGAHNANATAVEAWKVTPELLVQHAINTAFSIACGIDRKNICLSTVPPTAPPAPSVRMDLPYAIALRELFSEVKMRAQMNTKYMESSTREATVTHTLNLLISQLTSADIQSTITPDEGRNVPWHIYNIEAIDTAKQVFAGLDGINQYLKIDRSNEKLNQEIRELKERAVLMMEEMIAVGGYFEAVSQGFFVDSGFYPQRNGDGIARKIDGGIGADTVYLRNADYFAPVTAHFGENHTEFYQFEDPSSIISGCTFEDHNKIIYIDELDESDNVYLRLKESEVYRSGSIVKPEMEWQGDGVILLTMFIPLSTDLAKAAAIQCAKQLNLLEVEVIHVEVMHPDEGTRVEVKGKVPFDIDVGLLKTEPKPEILDEEVLKEAIRNRPFKIVSGTVGEDEHSVGLREIIDIKHGGIEKFGFECIYLGTSVALSKLVDAAIETSAEAILISTIISHDDVHYKNMKKLHDICVEKGVRDRLLLIAGGTQVTPQIARENGMDEGFGRKTKGQNVATFLVKHRKEGNG